MQNRFFTYILYSASIDKYYVGQTNDIHKRLHRHNAGLNRFSKRGIPWIIVYFEDFSSRAEAMRRERQIKAWKSRTKILELIHTA